MFNKLEWGVCTCLTQLYLMVDIYIYIILLHKGQLHVSALDNGHLQVVHEILSKQLYETYMGCIQWEVGEVGCVLVLSAGYSERGSNCNFRNHIIV